MLNGTFLNAFQNKIMYGIVDINNKLLVSSDYGGTKYAVVIDTLLSELWENCIKVFGWYDTK